MDKFLLMTSFARAVETGSFSAAARDLGIGQPNVSRYIASLEDHLGIRLLHRSTRKLALTPEGERYYAEIRRVLDAVLEAESTARGDEAPGGLLRVSCAPTLGRIHVLPRIGEFLKRYPKMEVDFQVTDAYVNLMDEGVDVAIRIGPLRDSSLRARRIGASMRMCFATNDYVVAHGEPLSPDDLLDHDCIVYTQLTTGASWKFRDQEIQVKGRLKVNTPDGIHGAVMAGLGIGYAPVWMFEEQIRAGTVRMLLIDHAAAEVPINIVYAEKRLLPKRASVFMDFIAEELARVPALTKVGLDGLMRG